MNIIGGDGNFIAPTWELGSRATTAATLTLGLLALAALGLAAAFAQRERRWYPVFVFLGAGLALFNEPYVDIMGHIAFPEPDTAVIEAFGREMPTYVLFAYLFYFTVPTLWIAKRIRSAMTETTWWPYFGGAVVLGFLEAVPVHFGWWTYYGDNQPFEIFGLPMWWPVVNAYLLMAIGLIVHLFVRYVPSQKYAPLLILILPVSVWTVYSSVSLPTYIALNSTTSLSTARLVSLLTVVLTLLMIALTGKLVAHETTRPAASSSEQRADPKLVGTT